ncbi:general secretion pathway protein GspF [Stenotrophomonas terrae]|uniref:General secretion pathway protein F n=1 Tax=Stenotrophomonas terrae TaxID=405446 RepID=A0A0R0CY27_9GAMM|nr:type II secretion system inner membrane protein GspF [Stenotrophomonas terrae]KRG71322.1 general secretion pathway protein GspF [Stenotrophomonas terrae]
MAAFEYLALSADGRRHKGVLEADSARQARQQLRERNLAPVQVEAAAARDAGTTASGGGRIGSSDLALLTRQLATLVQAALPVEEALRAVAAQTSKSRIRATLLAVRGRILEGHGLAAALAAYPRAFPTIYRSMVAAGERGHLGVVLEQLADYTEQRQQSRQRIQLALLYPLILLVVASLIVGFLLGYVVPDVIDVFVDSGQALPWLTRALVATSNAVSHWGPWLLPLLVISGVLLWRALQQAANRLRWDTALLKLPLFGLLLRDLDTARFASTLAILARSGVPLVEALRIAAQVVGNQCIKAGLLQSELVVREGGSLTRALEQHTPLPPMLLHMVAAGEKSGELDAMLARAARNQETDLAARIALLVGLFEPFMLVLMGVVVLLIVLAILLPIMSLNQLVG